MEVKMIPVVQRVIIDRVKEFHGYEKIHFYCGEKKSFKLWAEQLYDIAKKQEWWQFWETLTEFEKARIDKYVDTTLSLDAVLLFNEAVGKQIISRRKLLQCRMLSLNNFTDMDYRSVTFSPYENTNFRGHYFIHGYCDEEVDGVPKGLKAWIVFDFVKMTELMRRGEIKFEKSYKSTGEFRWVKYETLINAGLAVAYDVRVWGDQIDVVDLIKGIKEKADDPGGEEPCS
jgi:hypothetical protein